MVELRLSCRNARQERSGASSSLAVQTPGLLELENCSWNAASAAGMRLQRLVLGQQLPSQLAAHSHTRTSASCICISSQLPAPRSIVRYRMSLWYSIKIRRNEQAPSVRILQTPNSFRFSILPVFKSYFNRLKLF